MASEPVQSSSAIWHTLPTCSAARAEVFSPSTSINAATRCKSSMAAPELSRGFIPAASNATMPLTPTALFAAMMPET